MFARKHQLLALYSLNLSISNQLLNALKPRRDDVDVALQLMQSMTTMPRFDMWRMCADVNVATKTFERIESFKQIDAALKSLWMI
jgi:hypothetical protein